MFWNILTKKKKVFVPLLLLFFSTVPLFLALISQYFFGLHPCILCIYQRYVLGVAIGISAISLILSHKIDSSRSVLVLCGLVFMVGTGIAFFHVGVEQKWWHGTDDCGGENIAGNIEDLKLQILNSPVARCDEPEFVFLGLSMAGWNVVYSLGVVILCFVIYKFIGKNAVNS